jgi:hypothetical protein
MMRSLVIIATILVPAMGFSFRDVHNGVAQEVDEAPRVRGSNVGVRRAVKEGKADPKSKDGPATKGGPKGSGGGGASSSSTCETISVFTNQADYAATGTTIGNFGEAIEGLPIYDVATNRVFATITESVVDTGADCTALGAINFGLKRAGPQRSSNQLTYQGTCSGGLTNAITGGTGQFGGAKGVLNFVGPSGRDKFLFDLYVCEMQMQ